MAETDITHLFEQTLQGNYEDEAPWEAVRKLRHLGTREIFQYAADWCHSDDPLRRARGCDVLAQLGKTADHPTNNFPEDCYATVSQLAESETVVRPLGSAIAALGHIDDSRAIPLIAGHANHSDETIRFNVACALGSFCNDPESVLVLLKLTADANENVRDWAVFGVGVLGDIDSTEIRDTLVERLQDPGEEVREEAMVGLAKRKDQRVLTTLRSALQHKGSFVRPREAAALMLGMESDQEDWTAEEYLVALQSTFPR